MIETVDEMVRAAGLSKEDQALLVELMTHMGEKRFYQLLDVVLRVAIVVDAEDRLAGAYDPPS